MVRNILLITSDQQRADTLGVMGAPYGATPNIDALARDGVLFSEARCQHAYCQPSRWTILTGQHPRTHGVWTNGVEPPLDSQKIAFSERLMHQGMQTSFFGKAHFATVSIARKAQSQYIESFANSSSMADDWFGPYMGFAHCELMQMGHYPMGFGPYPLGLHYGRYLAQGSLATSLRRMFEASPANSLTRGMIAPQTWHSRLAPEYHPTNWVTRQASSWLRKNHEKPFFTWVSYADPHHPFDPIEPWCHKFKAGDMILPRRDVRELDGKPPFQKKFAQGLAWWTRALNPPGARVSDRELGTLMAAYYSMIAHVDHSVGQLVSLMKELGRLDDTLIIFASDHGELLGDHALLFKGPFHYDGLLKVPLVLSGGPFRGGKTSKALVGSVDLVPTFEEVLDHPFTPTDLVQGKSLVPAIDNDNARESCITDTCNVIGISEYVQTLVTKDYKLNRHVTRDYGELYDRQDDPQERVNRWSTDVSTRKALEEQLDATLPKARDPRLPLASWFPA